MGHRRCNSFLLLHFFVVDTFSLLLLRLPGVNFTNNIRAAFAPIFLRKKSTNLKSKYKKFCAKLLYVKAARKMLVKLTPGEVAKNVSPLHSLTAKREKDIYFLYWLYEILMKNCKLFFVVVTVLPTTPRQQIKFPVE
jgi:hypothetical protein